MKAGIPILDEVGEEIFDEVREGSLLIVRDEEVYSGNRKITEGRQLTLEDVDHKWKEANENAKAQLDHFVENTLEYAKKEKRYITGQLGGSAPADTDTGPPCIDSGAWQQL